jgi:arylsulfatase A-like enzyme
MISPGGGPVPEGPNIVMVLLDDLDAMTTPYWDAMPRTKALLADRGMTFTQAVAPTPICCAARASILAGQYGHNTGVLTNGGTQGGWKVFHDGGAEQRTFPIALQDAGYRTMLVGKYMNGYDDTTFIPPGWSEWYATADNVAYTGYGYTLNENGALVQYGTADDDYLTDVVSRKTTDFIDRSEADDDRPFFAYVAPTAPHLPLQPPRRYQPNPFDDATQATSPNFYEPDVSDKPWWLQLSAPSRDQTQGFNAQDYRDRLGSLLAVDDMVASIADHLEQAGELDDTVFVFTSDNGYNLGAHKLIHKMAPYEESQRVPLVIAGPGIAHGTDDHLTIQPDLGPTILDLAGIPALGTFDGSSLVPRLQPGAVGPFPTTYVEQYVGGSAANGIGAEMPPGLNFAVLVLLLGQELPTYRAIRTERYTYVEWSGPEYGGWASQELYDRDVDPWQLDNLVSTPSGASEHATLVDALTGRLDELATCAGATCRSLAVEPIPGAP